MDQSTISAKKLPVALVRELRNGGMTNNDLLYSLLLAVDPDEFEQAYMEVHGATDGEIAKRIADKHDINLPILLRQQEIDDTVSLGVQS